MTNQNQGTMIQADSLTDEDRAELADAAAVRERAALLNAIATLREERVGFVARIRELEAIVADGVDAGEEPE